MLARKIARFYSKWTFSRAEFWNWKQYGNRLWTKRTPEPRR